MTTFAFYGISDPMEQSPGDSHDHSLVLMDNGKVIEFLELERMSRKKHDNQLNFHFEDILQSKRLNLSGTPNIIFVDSFVSRSFTTNRGRIQLSAKNTSEDFLSNIPEVASGHFLDNNVNLYVCNHELAHVGANLAFTGGFEENSLLIHIDGGASNSNCSAWLYRNGIIQHLYHSWELQTHTTNFNTNPLSSAILGLPFGSNLDVAGKLMGYAGFGRKNEDLKSWLKLHNWFQDCDADMGPFFKAAASDHNWYADRFDQKDQFLMDIAACIQDDLEESVEEFISRFQDLTGARHLYYAGGVALNIDCNARLENSGLFESVHIPPCCNDTGLALGAASIYEFLSKGSVDIHTPFLNSLGVKPYKYEPKFKVSELATRIAHGEVIGICVGNGEIGPRALGHRSVIAKPTSLELRDKVSIDMKEREWYRPVAPMVLRSKAEDLFIGATTSNLSRYMLGSYVVRPSMRDLIPGVVHVDGNARAQVVDNDDGDLKLMVELLTELTNVHNVPCIINTSFNRRGEPIVHLHAEAIEAAREMGLNAVILDNEILNLG